MSEPIQQPKKRRPGFTTWIVIGLLLGVLAGLFFGEYTNSIKWMGDVYVGLLQMAVLPYVALSLIANIGRMSIASGVRLLRVGVVVLLGLWLVGLVTLAIMMLSFPQWESGSFFTSRFTEEPEPHNWLDLFVPSNPFRSLADNSIPAVVVFSIGIGIALMNIPGKERLLDPLDVLVDALARLNKLVVKLTPIGMFAIVAYTAGTIDFQQFNLIQGYLLTYGAAAIVLAFFVLPALVSAVTPLRFSDVTAAAHDPLITAFVIGNSFVVLPMIIESVKKLQAEHTSGEIREGADPEYLVPLAYPFPDIGRIVGLIFIPFAAWFYGTTLDPEQLPALLGVGMLGSFGKPVITIPLLLEIAELPGDIFNLFLASGVVAARFGDLMKTMNLLAFTLIAGCMIGGVFRVQWLKLALALAVSVGLLLVAALSIRGYLDSTFQDTYSREKLVTDREMVFPNDRRLSNVKAEVLDESFPNPDSIADGQLRVKRIVDRGIIRIGYEPDKMPFSYESADDKLIGFDIEMAYYLADDLGVDIEFVPIDRQDIHRQLAEDHFDVAMAAMEGTVRQAAKLPAIEPYMEATLAVVIQDHDKRDLDTLEEILAIRGLTLGVVKNSYFPPGRAESSTAIEVIEFESIEDYFDGGYDQVHGLVTNAESGSAWTLRHPEFTVVNPLKGRIRIPLYYLTAADPEFEGFLQNWLTLKRSDGTWQRLYDYWILGLDEETKTRRWCILRDVLEWVD